MIVCPKCKSRATKIINLSTGKYECQKCPHKWRPEYKNNLQTTINTDRINFLSQSP